MNKNIIGEDYVAINALRIKKWIDGDEKYDSKIVITS